MGFQALELLTRSLRFGAAPPGELENLTAAEWTALLDAADRQHLTLAFALRNSAVVPDHVRVRFARNVEGNRERFRRIQEAYGEISGLLEARGIPWVVLKGFSHWPGDDNTLPLRPQYDIDLWCLPRQAQAAQDAIMGGLGYEPVTDSNEFRADHMPQLIRKTGWRWRGDYFDPDLPLSVEVHYQLWDAAAERIAVDGLDEFWGRAVWKTTAGLRFRALDAVDAVAYAALHVVRHLFRGDLLLWHIYEFAVALEHRKTDDAFWSKWKNRYDDRFRRLQAVPFRLAREWFGCGLQACAEHETARLPPSVERWFTRHGRPPSEHPLFANKAEVWLHLSLLDEPSDAIGILRRKLLPIQKRRSLHHPHVAEAGVGLTLQRSWRHLVFVCARAAYHARTLPFALVDGLRWRFGRQWDSGDGRTSRRNRNPLS